MKNEKNVSVHTGAHIVYTDAILGYDEALREVDRRYKAHPDKYFFNSQYDMIITGVLILIQQAWRYGSKPMENSRILSRVSEQEALSQA